MTSSLIELCARAGGIQLLLCPDLTVMWVSLGHGHFHGYQVTVAPNGSQEIQLVLM